MSGPFHGRFPLPWVDCLLGVLGCGFAMLHWVVVAEPPLLGIEVGYACTITGLAALLFVRRTRPLTSFVGSYLLLAVLALVVALSPVNLGVTPMLFCAPLALMAVTEYAPSRWWGLAGLLLGVLGSVWSPARIFSETLLWSLITHAAMLVAAYSWASRRRWIRESQQRELRALQDHQAQELEIATVRERNRIAAEVHDIVGHTLTVVHAQATTGRVLGRRDPERALDALDAIADASKTSLDDVRYLVGMLREANAGPALHDLTELREVLGHARSAGVVVDDELPSPDALSTYQHEWPASIKLTVQRLVQEGVTNVIRHAGQSAMMRVALEVSDADCVVTVENNGVTTTSTRDGNGLLGLRERVSSVGATMRAGPVDGRFLLRAWIPLRDGERHTGHLPKVRREEA